jgi:hypothetical protein
VVALAGRANRNPSSRLHSDTIASGTGSSNPACSSGESGANSTPLGAPAPKAARSTQEQFLELAPFLAAADSPAERRRASFIHVRVCSNPLGTFPCFTWDRGFESPSLQRRVCELSVPFRANSSSRQCPDFLWLGVNPDFQLGPPGGAEELIPRNSFGARARALARSNRRRRRAGSSIW